MYECEWSYKVQSAFLTKHEQVAWNKSNSKCMVCTKWKDDDYECGWLMIENFHGKLEKNWIITCIRQWYVHLFMKRKWMV